MRLFMAFGLIDVFYFQPVHTLLQARLKPLHRFTMSSLQNAINIDDDDGSVVDLTDDKPAKKPKLNKSSLPPSKPPPSNEFIPFKLYDTKQSVGSAKSAARPPSTEKYFQSLRATLGFDGSKKQKFQYLIVCNYLFDVHYFLQQTMPNILSFKRVVVFYGEGVDAEGMEYWRGLLKGSGNTVDFVRLIPSDPPRSKTNPLDVKIPYGVHHTKMFLVGYDECNQQNSSEWKSFIRLVVHTANMVQQDVEWKSQGLYSQDFPLKSDEAPSSVAKQQDKNNQPEAASQKRGWPFEDDDPQPFEDDLVTYLESYRYSTRQSWTAGQQSPKTLSSKEMSLLNLIRQYDFSSAYAVLVPSVPGKHSGSNAKSFGYLKLQKAIQEHVLSHHSHAGGNADRKPSAQPVKSPIICQFSSMGSLSLKWLHDFISALDVYGSNDEVQGKKKKPEPSIADKMKIVWPTVEEIRTSIEGYSGGNSVPGTSKNINKDFLSPLYHRWSKSSSGRQNNHSDPLKTARNVPHIKTFLQLSQPTDDKPPSIEWLCLTSHNLSKAAWGEFQNSAGSTSKVFFIRHWELGVFISLSTLAKQVLSGGDCSCQQLRIRPFTGINSNDGPIVIDCDDKSSIVDIIVPLPFDAIDPERYSDRDVPWTVDGGGKNVPDSFGMIWGP